MNYFSPDHLQDSQKASRTNNFGSFILITRVLIIWFSGYVAVSSGALMDSLLYNAIIIGPDFGAFRDLSREGIVYTFDSYSDLQQIIVKACSSFIEDHKLQPRTEEFIKENSWEAF